MLPDGRRVRVLVADDDPDIRELVTIVLSQAGYDVKVAADGAAALDVAETFDPALVVLDINMPRLDGFGVLRTLRATPAHARTAVLMLTARNLASDVASARRLGASDYLVKPFDPGQLLAKTARLTALGSPPRLREADPGDEDIAYI